MRILIVDDNAALADTLKMMLELMGHETEIAATGQQAIEMTRTSAPEVILLDIGLPDIDGFNVCKILRCLPNLARTTIIAQSGRDDLVDKEKARESGFDHFVVKPVPMEQLERLIASIGHESV